MSKRERGAAVKERKSERSKGKGGKDKRKEKAASKPAAAQAIEPMIDDLRQTPSRKLAAIVGDQPLSLRQANQMVWAYVQRKGFQDPQAKHMIRLKGEKGEKEPLKDVIGEKPISMFEMSAILRKHLSS